MSDEFAYYHEHGIETLPPVPVFDRPLYRPFERIAIDLNTEPEPWPVLVTGIYESRLTVLQSEPGVGKSWLAIYLALQVMERGRSVVYLDEEGGHDLVHYRLKMLGADPELVNELFFYYAFEQRAWSNSDIEALDAVISEAKDCCEEGIGLGVFDSLPDFLAAADLKENEASDVMRFVSRVCARFRDEGAAQLLLDHLKKPDGTKARGRYARGSGSKLGKTDATLLLEAEEEFDMYHNGVLRLWKTKDRNGRLQLPYVSKEEGFRIDVEVERDVSVRFIEQEPVWTEGPVECMESICALLAVDPATGLNFRQIRAVVPYRNSTVMEALDRLVKDQKIIHKSGPKNSKQYHYAGTGQLWETEF